MSLIIASYNLSCDHCGQRSPFERETGGDLRELAARFGWARRAWRRGDRSPNTRGVNVDLCPRCSE